MTAPGAASGGFSWIDPARVLGMLAVVALHAAALQLTRSSPFGADWWQAQLLDAGTRWAVPLFVMISGALLLDPGQREETLGAFARKRAARLLLPLLAWSLFYALWARWQHGGWPPLRLWLAGQPYYHLWFLYMLLGLYALTPMLRRWLRTAPPAELHAALLLGFALALLDRVHAQLQGAAPPLFLRSFLLYLPYFLLGHWLQQRVAAGPPWRAGLLFGAGLLLTAGGYAALQARGGTALAAYAYDYLSPGVLLSSLGVGLALRAGRRWRAERWQPLAALSFGVYLVHPLWLELSLQTALRPLWRPAAVGLPLQIAAVLGLSLLTVGLLRRLPGLRRCV